jgi:hypothetical protein
MTMKCDEMKDLFAEALYDELPDARMAAFNAHLAACGTCRREFEGLKRTIVVMSRRERVEPTDAEWADFSRRPDGRLAGDADGTGEQGRRVSGRPHDVIPWFNSFRPAWGYGIVAILLVAFGIYMGRRLFNGTPGAPDTPAGSGSQTGVNRDAPAYLERSRNLLLGLTNVDENRMSPAGFDRSRKVSRELYNKGNTLAVALNRPSQQQLRQLVQGLQIILLQLSNMDAGNGTPVVEMVRKGVDSKSILLKINLEAIRAAGSGDKNSL